MKKYDVVVAGGGISGCASAISFANDNKNVTVLEMNECAVNPGSNGFWVIDIKYIMRELKDKVPKYLCEIIRKCIIIKYDEIMLVSPFGKKYVLPIKNYVVDRTEMQSEMMDLLNKKGVDVFFGTKVRFIGDKKVHTSESSYFADKIVCACGVRALELGIYKNMPISACAIQSYIHGKFDVPPAFFISANFPGGFGYIIPLESGGIAGAILRRESIFYNPSYFFYYFLKRLDVYDRSMGKVYATIFLPNDISLRRSNINIVGMCAGHSSFFNGIYTSAISGCEISHEGNMKEIEKIVSSSWKTMSILSKSDFASSIAMRIFRDKLVKKIIMLNNY